MAYVTMNNKTFSLKIITAKEIAYDGAVESLIVPGERGYVGILADHAPFVTTLSSGLLTLKNAGRQTRFQIGNGFLEVLKNQARILTETASPVS